MLPLYLRNVDFVKDEVIDSCLMLDLGTGGARAGGLVVCEATQDDDVSLVDCLECVNYAKVSTLVINYTYIYMTHLNQFSTHVSYLPQQSNHRHIKTK
jgi:hypothetical protein